METQAMELMQAWAGYLETFLVEWKQRDEIQTARAMGDLETFLVEWKPAMSFTSSHGFTPLKPS